MLTVRYSLELTAARFGLEVEVVRTLLNTGLEKLFQARKRRPKPHLDSKMLAAWNGGTAVSEARPVHRITLHKALPCVRHLLYIHFSLIRFIISGLRLRELSNSTRVTDRG